MLHPQGHSARCQLSAQTRKVLLRLLRAAQARGRGADRMRRRLRLAGLRDMAIDLLQKLRQAGSLLRGTGGQGSGLRRVARLAQRSCRDLQRLGLGAGRAGLLRGGAQGIRRLGGIVLRGGHGLCRLSQCVQKSGVARLALARRVFLQPGDLQCCRSRFQLSGMGLGSSLLRFRRAQGLSLAGGQVCVRQARQFLTLAGAVGQSLGEVSTVPRHALQLHPCGAQRIFHRLAWAFRAALPRRCNLGQRGLRPAQDAVHAAPARHLLDLSCDGTQQIPARAHLILVARLKPRQPLTHPEQARRPRAPGHGRQRLLHPIIGLAPTGDHLPVGQARHLRGFALQEGLGDGKAPVRQVHLRRDAHRAARMGLQGFGGGGHAAMAQEEQCVQRVKKGGFAELIGLRHHGQPVADPLQMGALPAKATHVFQCQAAQLHLGPPSARSCRA